MRPEKHEIGEAPPSGAPPRNTRSVFLTDFGLAKSTATGSKLTRTGVALGTPAYMSPEQARGDLAELAPATDVWALGCVLYEMLAGRPAFRGETPAEIVARVLLHEPVPLRGLRPDAPRDAERVIRVCLSKRPRARPRDAAALRDDLERILRGERPLARPGSRKRPALAVGAALLAVVAIAAGGILASRGPHASPSGPASPASASPAPTRASELASRAWASRFQDPRAAADLLRQALDLDPGAHENRIRLGLLLWSVGQGAAARAEWDRIPTGAVQGTGARLYRGLEALFRFSGPGDIEEARPDLEAIAMGEGMEARVARGALAEIRGDWEAARRELQEVPGWEAAFLRAYLEFNDPQGDLRNSVREARLILERGIPSTVTEKIRGSALESLKDWRAAEEAFSSALALDASDPLATVHRARVRQELGDLAGAQADTGRALELAPDSLDAYIQRGSLRKATGDVAGARADYDEILRRDPTHFRTLHNRGLLRVLAGDAHGAIEDFTAALRAHPDHPDAAETWDELGSSRNESGDYAGADQAHREALRRRPGWSRALVNLSNDRVGLDDLEGARAALDEAIGRDPEFPEALFNRGLLRHRLGDHAGAIEDHTRAVRARPSYAAAFNSRGAAREAGGDVRGAEADYAEAVRLRPGFGIALSNLGMARRSLGEWAGAVQAFESYLRQAPPGDPERPGVENVLAECREAAAYAASSGR